MLLDPPPRPLRQIFDSSFLQSHQFAEGSVVHHEPQGLTLAAWLAINFKPAVHLKRPCTVSL